MPSTVVALLEAAGLEHGGVVAWGEPVPCDRPGIYLVALTSDPNSTEGAVSPPLISLAAVEELTRRATDLTLDRRPNPHAQDVADRLIRLWLDDEVVVYIGKASRSVRQRVGQYYATPLGNRSPHAGGWALKTLNLADLWVHWAESSRAELSEQQTLAAFVDGTSPTTRETLLDPKHPYPFANLEGPGGRKHHGIGGARSARRSPGSSRSATKPAVPPRKVATRSPDAPAHSSGKVTLHAEIADILRENGNRWMTTQEIARLVARRGRYKKQDRTSNVTAFQVHGRTKNYPKLFERQGSNLRLRG